MDEFLSVISKVQRPGVIYFSADHFDSIGPITEQLRRDPRDLMQLRDGKPLELNNFGYRIMPYTLSTDANIPINKYRRDDLNYVAQRIRKLPKAVQSRIVAYPLTGELRHLVPDFENGMGAYQDIQVTDYSAASVASFRQWLRVRYQAIEQFNTRAGLSYVSFGATPVSLKIVRKEKLTPLASITTHSRMAYCRLALGP